MISLKEYILLESSNTSNKLIAFAKFIVDHIKDNYRNKISEFRIKSFLNNKYKGKCNNYYDGIENLPIKVFKLQLKKYDKTVYVLYNNCKDEKDKQFFFDDKNSFNGKHSNDCIIFIKTPYKTISDCISTFAHELTHAYDDLFSDENIKKTFNTYGKDDDKKFDKFLYLISPTEQHAYYVDFKNALKNGNFDKLLFAERKNINNVNELLQTIAEEDVKNKNGETVKDNNNNILKIKDVNQQIKFLSYKFTHLNSKESFEKFINNYEKDKDYILKKLSVFTDGNKDLDKIYDAIIKVYNKTYNDYKQLIEAYIKKHNK